MTTNYEAVVQDLRKWAIGQNRFTVIDTIDQLIAHHNPLTCNVVFQATENGPHEVSCIAISKRRKNGSEIELLLPIGPESVSKWIGGFYLTREEAKKVSLGMVLAKASECMEQARRYECIADRIKKS